ncbi:hypothetical protein [Niallia sp. FSL K6-0077]|uniref:hypothetical protein n=1 Tax=Niallia sp. FSL K6-0077 TaxID=2954743 RepID=UPI0030F7EECC
MDNKYLKKIERHFKEANYEMDRLSIENHIMLSDTKERNRQVQENDIDHEDLEFDYEVVWEDGEDKAVLYATVADSIFKPGVKATYYGDLVFYKNGLETMRKSINCEDNN